MKWGRKLRRLHAVLDQFGLDPLRGARAIVALPRFVRDLIVFKRRYHGTVFLWPCLHDRDGEAGAVQSEYFWQDLYVAQRIHEADPERHVDVGSRLDGFVAHLASFREVELVDIRPLRVKIPRVQFRQVDITDLPEDMEGYCDSVSCLHALEHVGLGRYGDAIDHEGWETAFKNLVRLLAQGGRLYLSVPCGQERIEFNAHRVFDPQRILALAVSEGLELETATVIRPGAGICEVGASSAFQELAKGNYALVVFVFMKR